MKRDNQCDLLKLFILLERPMNLAESTTGTLGMLRIASVLNAVPQSTIAKESLIGMPRAIHGENPAVFVWRSQYPINWV